MPTAARRLRCRRVPRATRRARARIGKQLLQRTLSPAASMRIDPVELGRYASSSRAQRLAIGDANIAPHLGMAARQPGEVAKAARGKAKIVVGVGARREFADQRKGQRMRQMTHRGEELIVAFGVELADLAAALRPAVADAPDRPASVSGIGVRITLRSR